MSGRKDTQGYGWATTFIGEATPKLWCMPRQERSVDKEGAYRLTGLPAVRVTSNRGKVRYIRVRCAGAETGRKRLPHGALSDPAE